MSNIFIALIWILITMVIYIIFNKAYISTKNPLLNPAVASMAAIILVLVFLDIPYESYCLGGDIITSILSPMVVALAIPLYRNRYKIKAHFKPIIGGILAGIFTSFVSVTVLGRLLSLDSSLINSLMAKSITTPMAIEGTKLLGGIEAVTIAAVIITGNIGALIAPFVIKIGHIKNEMAKGIGIGTASHGVGTSKAIEISEEAGSASGLSIAITGVLTILIISIGSKFI